MPSSRKIRVDHFDSAHDLRRTCSKLCRKAGSDLKQIKFLLGHSSIQTTERYLRSEQELAIAVNDNVGPPAVSKRARDLDTEVAQYLPARLCWVVVEKNVVTIGPQAWLAANELPDLA